MNNPHTKTDTKSVCFFYFEMINGGGISCAGLYIEDC